jgi:hypothetical protein
MTLAEKINSVKSISVCTIEIPMTIYNISSSLGNNCFRLDEDWGENGYNEYMVVIPDGYYTYQELLNKINDYVSLPYIQNNTLKVKKYRIPKNRWKKESDSEAVS